MMTTEQMLLAALAALTATIVALWRRIELDKTNCEEDRDKLWAHIMDQSRNTCVNTQGCDKRVMPNPPQTR